jgi:Protein of unknown function (DUF3619)
VNEQEFARKVAQNLDVSLGDLPASTLYKLQFIRQHAVSRYNAATVDGRGGIPTLLTWKWAAPAAVLVLISAAYLLQRDSSSDTYELEAQMLADDLPIHAYLDEGFETWLQKTSED